MRLQGRVESDAFALFTARGWKVQRNSTGASARRWRRAVNYTKVS